MKEKIKLHISEKIATWLEQYEGKEKSVIDLYSDYIADTPPDENFNICGNIIKVWHDDFFGVLYIEIADKLSSEYIEFSSYISEHFSEITPHRYINFDDENKVITLCSIISVNDKEYTREFFRKMREDSNDFLDAFETILEDDDEITGGVDDE